MSVDELTSEQLMTLVEAAAAQGAPAWPLRNFVASNPLANLEAFDFEDAARMAQTHRGGQSYLPLAEYLRLFEEGRITPADLRSAIAETRCSGGHKRSRRPRGSPTPADDSLTGSPQTPARGQHSLIRTPTSGAN